MARVCMVGEEYPATEVWAYNGIEPGPVLRVRQGTPIRVTAVSAWCVDCPCFRAERLK